MKCNLNTLYKVHAFIASMLLVLDILVCVQANVMFGFAGKYVWPPAIPLMIWTVIIIILAMCRKWPTFLLGLLEVLYTSQTFKTFLQIPTWEISFDPYSLVTTSLMAEVLAILNLAFLITSLFGTYFFVKKIFSQKRSG